MVLVLVKCNYSKNLDKLSVATTLPLVYCVIGAKGLNCGKANVGNRDNCGVSIGTLLIVTDGNWTVCAYCNSDRSDWGRPTDPGVNGGISIIDGNWEGAALEGPGPGNCSVLMNDICGWMDTMVGLEGSQGAWVIVVATVLSKLDIIGRVVGW